jgi:hypothetical protein
MTAVQRFRNALQEYRIEDNIIAQIFEGYEKISDNVKKEKRAVFFIQAIERMEQLLDDQLCRDIRDACACSKGGFRLKAVQKIAREYSDKSIEEKLQALSQAPYMGKPVLNDDGTITTGIGDEGGFPCACPVFDSVDLDQPVSITYCYCCAGHFRFHYQIALGIKLRTKEVVSSALASQRKDPCRFVYEILE